MNLADVNPLCAFNFPCDALTAYATVVLAVLSIGIVWSAIIAARTFALEGEPYIIIDHIDEPLPVSCTFDLRADAGNDEVLIICQGPLGFDVTGIDPNDTAINNGTFVRVRNLGRSPTIRLNIILNCRYIDPNRGSTPIQPTKLKDWDNDYRQESMSWLGIRTWKPRIYGHIQLPGLAPNEVVIVFIRNFFGHTIVLKEARAYDYPDRRRKRRLQAIVSQEVMIGWGPVVS
jgi:hypothetical protein